MSNKMKELSLPIFVWGSESDNHVKWPACLQKETQNSVLNKHFRAEYIDASKVVFFFKMVELAQTRQQHEYASSVGLLAINLLWLYVIAQCGDCWKRNMKIKPRKTDPYLKFPFSFNSIDSLTCSTMPHTTVEHNKMSYQETGKNL